jgi:amino acid adenylation domain-containing protein
MTLTRESVTGRLAFWAQERPDETALVGESGAFTFRELTNAITRTSTTLADNGVRAGTKVGVLLPRSSESIVCILAILQCGAAYVPLDRTQPVERLLGMIHDAGISALIVDPTTAVGRKATEAASRECEKVVVLPVRRIVGAPSTSRSKDRLAITKTGRVSSGTTHRRFDDTNLDDELAYIIFTSGSTGRPKGVKITHANLCALMHAWDSIMGDQRHVSMMLSTLSFDASVCELFWPLWNGSTLVICPDVTVHGSKKEWRVPLNEVIKNNGVTHLQCTPTRAMLMLSDPSDRAALGSIEHLVIGGEALNNSLANDLLACGIPRITNAYGPTEVTVWAATYEVRQTDLSEGVVPIGLALAGMKLDVVDDDGNAVIDGAIGELAIAGPQVSIGYADNAELTAQKFVRLPNRKDIWYRTGDLASRRNDGISFDFHGRRDAQVKLRGHRIELGEIEACLDSYLAVHQSVALLHMGAVDEIVAVVQPKEEIVPLRADLDRHVRASLPQIMAPSRYLVVNEFPLTSSGKVDRVAVAGLLGPTRKEPKQPTVERRSPNRPRTKPAAFEIAAKKGIDREIESLINDFRVVLNKPNADADSDFFQLGGHSLHAVEVISRIQARNGIRVPLDAVLQSPTPRGLVRHLARGGEPSRTLVRFGLPGKRILFLIHGAGGTVMGFRRLAVALSPHIELIGIQATGVDDGTQPDQDLATMVARYVDQIKAHQAGGDTRKVHIGGYSDGGIIALHVARALLDKSSPVPIQSIVLLDALTPTDPPRSLRTKLVNVHTRANQRGSLSVKEFGKSVVTGWKRRREYDEAGVAALKTLGYADVYQHIHRIVVAGGDPPFVNAPGLLIRTLHNSPTTLFDYTFGLTRTATLDETWVSGKHDEVLFPEQIPSVSQAISDFIR